MGGIYVTSDGMWSDEIDTRIGKSKPSTVWALSLCGQETGAFKHCKAVSF